MFPKLRKGFKKWLRGKSPRAKELRRSLSFEPLEDRSLLSVSLTVDASAILPPNPGVDNAAHVPIVNCTVIVSYNDPLPETENLLTDTEGECTFTLNSLNVNSTGQTGSDRDFLLSSPYSRHASDRMGVYVVAIVA